MISEWIEALINESFAPCNIDSKARDAVKTLLNKYKEQLVRDALQKAIIQARRMAKQKDRTVCEYLQEMLEKNWLTEFCEGYANAMID